MRLAVLAALTLAGPTMVAGQDTAIVINPESTTTGAGPRSVASAVALEAVRFFNAATTARLVGRLSLPAGGVWHGDVAVRHGSVTLGGRIEGSVLVIDGDASLDSTAEVTGSLTVLGGAVVQAPGARVGGEVHAYPESFAYRTNGDQIAIAPHPRRRVPFLGARKTWTGSEARSSLTLATGGTFNRVEGLPLVLGPEFAWNLPDGLGLRADALGILRTVGTTAGEPGDLGYMLGTELRAGSRRGAGVAAKAYSIVRPVETWGLRSSEVGWAAFLFGRDYRDYYFARGASGTLFAQPGEPLTVSLDLAYEWQTSVAARDPWTVARNNQPWRPNPPSDPGHYTTLTGAVTFDTRNDREQPTAGWYLQAEIANTWGPDVEPQAVPVSVRRAIPTDGSYEFSRFFLDARRYTRVSSSGRVNLRLLAGGWLGGDPLPLQQRMSMGGSAPMPGYGFRQSACNTNLTDSVFVGTLVAACDRMILTQVEYRGHLSLHWSYGRARPEDENSKPLFTLQGPDLVVFGDAGQAWLVGSGPGRLSRWRLPTIGSWLADLGLGMDWGGFGVYVAKAVTAGDPLRFTVRLDHRF